MFAQFENEKDCYRSAHGRCQLLVACIVALFYQLSVVETLTAELKAKVVEIAH